MEITNELLSKILSGDSSSKVAILDWHIEDNIAPGNNHSSMLSRLMVEYQRKGKIFKKSFILKIPSTHPAYNFGIKFKLYEKEYPMYTEVLEEMYKIDGEHIGPRLYYTDDKYSLMMKDLSLSGYKAAERTKQLDFHHCCLVLKKLARFHGLSVKLNQCSKINSTIKRQLWTDDIKWEERDKECPRRCCELLAEIVHPKFGLHEKFHQIKDDVWDTLRQEIIPDRFGFHVLIHGDLWLGNTLFKYDKYGDVTKVKFIDFQFSSWSSPVFDILNFTLCSIRFDVFERHFDFLMETYIETLNKTLKFVQCDLLYSLEELYSDMENLPATVIMNLSCRLPGFLHGYENPVTYETFIKNGNFDSVAHHETFFKNELYLKILNQWVSHYHKKGLFDLI
ncbi:uncharacterized protein LOC135846307 [Planococcus citri]|uniref:uncharacterized protein LOC135846307 n=1 Tax=Planococcus citri TaxID=170843 RepID=UPI0031F726F0